MGSPLSRAFRHGRLPTMSDEYQANVQSLSLAKALAIAAYGESVAAFRYRTILDRVTDESLSATFLEMAREEQGHHARLQKLQRELFPGSDFVLTPEDKELVIVGPRLLDVTEDFPLSQTVEMMARSERLTGRFYTVLAKATATPHVKSFLQEMADECFDHAKLLNGLKPKG